MSNEEFTLFCRNLSEQVTESVLYELFVQAGPVEDVRIPMQDGRNKSFGFVVYKHKCSVRLAIDLFNDISLYGKRLALQNRVLDAAREAEMRNRVNESFRNGEINALRGAALLSSSRGNELNNLQPGHSTFSPNDALNSLRGGPIGGFSRMDNMMPRGFSDKFSSGGSNSNNHQIFQNPYSTLLLNTSYQSQDQRNSPSQHFERYGSHSYDRNSRCSREDVNHHGNSRNREDSRHSRDNSRRDHNHRADRDHKFESRHRGRRSRSRDRSPVARWNSDRHRRNR